MHRIDVDFEVYKQLTARRPTEEVTYNDVIRELLRVAQSVAAQHLDRNIVETSKDWVVRGVLFPFGTEFRGLYQIFHATGGKSCFATTGWTDKNQVLFFV